MPVTESFTGKFVTRQRMHAAKAWRCFIELPQDTVLAARLTGDIGTQTSVNFAIGLSDITISPAYIHDVTNKGKKFTLVVETVYEQQSDIGPYLTGMVGEDIGVMVGGIEPARDSTGDSPATACVDNNALKWLHISCFTSEIFWKYLQQKTHKISYGPAVCKDIFKEYMGITSCKKLSKQAFNAMRQDFMAYVEQQ